MTVELNRRRLPDSDSAALKINDVYIPSEVRALILSYCRARPPADRWRCCCGGHGRCIFAGNSFVVLWRHQQTSWPSVVCSGKRLSRSHRESFIHFFFLISAFFFLDASSPVVCWMQFVSRSMVSGSKFTTTIYNRHHACSRREKQIKAMKLETP